MPLPVETISRLSLSSADPGFGWMHKAEIADHIHNPEVFVARGGLHDLFSGWQLDQSRVFQLCVGGDDVLGMVLDGAGGCILRRGTNGRKREGNRDDEDKFGVHSRSSGS